MEIRVAFPTDEHFPFQDDNARSVALQIVHAFKPDARIALSDGMDFYSVSHFDKDPSVLKAGGLQKEIDAWRAGQREWRDAAPRAQVYPLLGNHEDRLRKYMWRHPELHDLDALKLESLLGFTTLGITEDVKEEFVFGGLVVTHGTRVSKHSGYSAKGELENEFYSATVMSGHTHRMGTHYARTRKGVVSAHECGCLCRLDPAYVRFPNWQQGIALATVTDYGVTVEMIPFFRELDKVVARWRGKEYRQA